jgi:hypothetical protein
MKKRKKPSHFYCNLFGANVYFFVGWSQKDFSEYLMKNYNSPVEASDSNGVTKQIIHNGAPIIMIWIRSGKRLLPTLVHESIHATNLILYVAGVRPSFINDELQAYYSAMLFKFGIENK